MPKTRTKTKARVKNRRGKSTPTAKGMKRGPHKTQAPIDTAYDAKKYAGSVAAFAGVTAEEISTWRDDR